MTNGHRIGATLMALVVSGTLGAAQARPDCAGIWRSDNAKNPAVHKGLVTNVDLEIRQDEQSITIIQLYSQRRTIVYRFDVTSASILDADTASWTGDRLTLMQQRGAVRRGLGIAGNELTMEWFFASNRGPDPDIRMIYRKAP